MNHNEKLPQKLLEMLSEDTFTIFLFHGVINKSNYKVRNYNGKHIQANLFAKCMKLLNDNGNAFSMDELLNHHVEKKKLPPNSFAITFDDGFENNISIAAPILYDFKIPSTIYVTTGFIESNKMSWIDRIEYAVENIHSKNFYMEWIKEEASLKDVKSKIYFLNSIRNYVKNTPNCNPDRFADLICDQLGFQEITSSDDPLDKKMNWNQVYKANSSELIIIGGHTHSHHILSYLNKKQLANEIDTSLELLNKKAGVKPTHYSYPEGLEHCYSENVIIELKKRGVLCCPTAIHGFNNILDDLFHLKRVMI